VSGDVRQVAGEVAGGTERLCLFSVAGEALGVPVPALFEVVSEALITPLPEVPAGLVGLMNFRGEILPVVDLGPWIGIPVIPRLQVMVLQGGGHQIGVAVDAIRDMVDASLAPAGAQAGGDAPLGGALWPLAGEQLTGVSTPPPRVWFVDADHLVERLVQTLSPVVEVV